MPMWSALSRATLGVVIDAWRLRAVPSALAGAGMGAARVVAVDDGPCVVLDARDGEAGAPGLGGQPAGMRRACTLYIK